MSALRGRVYVCDLGYGQKPYLCVSNNARNRALDSFLAVRITTSRKPALDSLVPLASTDAPLVGTVLCDDIFTVAEDEVIRDGGALSLPTMLRIAAGLRSALAL